jgi:hypothetical protein
MKPVSPCSRWSSMFFHAVLVFITFYARGYCSEPPAVAGYTQMTASGAQVLSIKNYRKGQTCNWSIQNDDGQKGTLSSATGENVTYTAPGANPGCGNSPIIQVECDGQIGTFNIAVNGYMGSQTAWVEVDDWKSKFCNGSDKKCGWRTCDAYCLRWKDYTCAGFYHEYSCQTSEAPINASTICASPPRIRTNRLNSAWPGAKGKRERNPAVLLMNGLRQ